MFNFKDFVARKFKDDTAIMLIWTGAIGWALSCVAQMGAVLANSKFSKKEKSFLLPQELCDGLVNILLFAGITSVARYGVHKMFTTGKWAPKNVHNYLKTNPFFAEKVGKFDFNFDDYVDKLPKNIRSNIKNEYESYRDFATTLTTVGAGIVASNIVTPLARNKAAALVQNKYQDYKYNTPYSTTYSGNMKI